MAWTLVLLFILTSVHAETLEKPQVGLPYLWKIEGVNEKPSWIFGTIHLQRPEVAKPADSVRAAADSADAVYTEIPLDPASMLSLTPQMMLPKNKSLKKILGPKLIATVEDEFRKINPEFTLAPFAHFQPWALAMTLMQIEDQIKYPGTLALDFVVFQRAAMAGKETGGLETLSEQLALFNNLTEADQVAMVEDVVEQFRSIREHGESPSDLFTRLYLAGDLDALVTKLLYISMTGKHKEANEKFLEHLLYRRNAIMTDRMIEKMHAHSDKSYFFAVGAAHLQGDRGILAALEKKGFRLTRVSSH